MKAPFNLEHSTSRHGSQALQKLTEIRSRARSHQAISIASSLVVVRRRKLRLGHRIGRGGRTRGRRSTGRSGCTGRRRRSGGVLLVVEASPFRPFQLRPLLLRLGAANVRARGLSRHVGLVGARGHVLGLGRDDASGSRDLQLLIALPSQSGSLQLLVVLLLHNDRLQQLRPVGHLHEEPGPLPGQSPHQVVELLRHPSC